MPLTYCVCGGDPEIGPSETRVQKRQAAEARYAQATAQPHARGDGKREYEAAMRALHALQADAWEVRCPECGRYVIAESEAAAELRWNRAVEKLAAREECCRAATDVRIDHDGQVIVRCDTCGRRHFALEPSDG